MIAIKSVILTTSMSLYVGSVSVSESLKLIIILKLHSSHGPSNYILVCQHSHPMSIVIVININVRNSIQLSPNDSVEKCEGCLLE